MVHNNLRARFEQGEPAVLDTMTRLAELTIEAREAILARNAARLDELIDLNFDLRRSICRIPAAYVEMVERARAVGVTAKFAGSGGTIIGTYRGDAVFQRLQTELSSIGCRVIRPSTL